MPIRTAGDGPREGMPAKIENNTPAGIQAFDRHHREYGRWQIPAGQYKENPSSGGGGAPWVTSLIFDRDYASTPELGEGYTFDRNSDASQGYVKDWEGIYRLVHEEAPRFVGARYVENILDRESDACWQELISSGVIDIEYEVTYKGRVCTAITFPSGHGGVAGISDGWVNGGFPGGIRAVNASMNYQFLSTTPLALSRALVGSEAPRLYEITQGSNAQKKLSDATFPADPTDWFLLHSVNRTSNGVGTGYPAFYVGSEGGGLQSELTIYVQDRAIQWSRMIDSAGRPQEFVAYDSWGYKTTENNSTWSVDVGTVTEGWGTVTTEDYDTPLTTMEGLLIEEERTNEVSDSVDFSDAIWSYTRASNATTSVTGPDGTDLGTSVLKEDNTAANNHRVQHTGLAHGQFTNSAAVTYSVYVKAANRDGVGLQFADKDGTLIGKDFELAGDGEIHNDFGSAPDSAGIEAIGSNGWYRCWITTNDCGTGTTNLVCYVYALEGQAGSNEVFDGLDQDSLYLWNAQVEEGAFPTSPIPTTGSADTRYADELEYADVDIPDEEGTIYMEVELLGDSDAISADHQAVLIGPSGVTGQRPLSYPSGDNNAHAGDGSNWMDLTPTGQTMGAVSHRYAVNWETGGDLGGAYNGNQTAQTGISYDGSWNGTGINIGMYRNNDAAIASGIYKSVRIYNEAKTDDWMQQATLVGDIIFLRDFTGPSLGANATFARSGSGAMVKTGGRYSYVPEDVERFVGARYVENLVQTLPSGWTPVTSGTGAAPVINPDNSVTFSKTVGLGRSYLISTSWGNTVEANKRYIMSCTLVDYEFETGSQADQRFFAFSGTANPSNDGDIIDGMPRGKRIFQAHDSTINTAFRIGLGSLADETNLKSVTLKDFMIEEAPFQGVGPYDVPNSWILENTSKWYLTENGNTINVTYDEVLDEAEGARALCEGLLMEPERTNDLTQSIDITVAPWTKHANLTRTGGQQSFLFGDTSAVKIGRTGGTGGSESYNVSGGTWTNGQSMAHQLFFEVDPTDAPDEIGMGSRINGSWDPLMVFNVSAETLTVASDTNGTLDASGVDSLGVGPNGGQCYRCWWTFTVFQPTGTGAYYIYPKGTGDQPEDQGFIYHNQAQQEDDATYPTSPIPTSGSADTRYGDDLRYDQMYVGHDYGTIYLNWTPHVGDDPNNPGLVFGTDDARDDYRYIYQRDGNYASFNDALFDSGMSVTAGADEKYSMQWSKDSAQRRGSANGLSAVGGAYDGEWGPGLALDLGIGGPFNSGQESSAGIYKRVTIYDRERPDWWLEEETS